MLASLVRKEVLSLRADPRSAERGQYGSSRISSDGRLRDALAARAQGATPRRGRILREARGAAATQEIVEVVAAHYLTAFELEPDAADAAELHEGADALARAGERAASLGANGRRRFVVTRAADLIDDPHEEARAPCRSGKAARAYGDSERARRPAPARDRALSARLATARAARASADLADGEFSEGRPARRSSAWSGRMPLCEADAPDEDHRASFLSQLGRWLFFAGRFDDLRRAQRTCSLTIAERTAATRGVLARPQHEGPSGEFSKGVGDGARAQRHALAIALESDIRRAMSRALHELQPHESRLGNLAAIEALTLRASTSPAGSATGRREWFTSATSSDSVFPHRGSGTR